MRAKVIEIDQHQLHLEIENAVRFSSPYIGPDHNVSIKQNDIIDFFLTRRNRQRLIVVTDVVSSHVAC